MKERVTLQITLLHKSFFFFPSFQAEKSIPSLHDDADLERHTSHHQSSQIKKINEPRHLEFAISTSDTCCKTKTKGGGGFVILTTRSFFFLALCFLGQQTFEKANLFLGYKKETSPKNCWRIQK